MQQLQTNSTLQGGKYIIKKVLGQGGFGITYLAEHDLLGTKVAIKEFFMKDFCNREETTSHVSVVTESGREQVNRFREKFLKEARNIAKLRHPNIVRISDVFEENGTAYYVMDFCEGGSLSELLKLHPNGIGEPLALKYIRQVASALELVHSMKMNHLDVKPANILIDAQGNIILIDFGLSKQYDAETGQQTSTTPVGISEGYAPMEQYRKGGVCDFSPSTDIYALGATLYKLITGQTPPSALDLGEEPLPKFRSSSQVKKAICSAMEHRRADRPQSIAAFLSVLDGDSEETIVKVEPEPTLTPTPEPQSQPKPTPHLPPIPRPVSEPQPSKINKPIIYGIIAVVVIIVCFLLTRYIRGKEEIKLSQVQDTSVEHPDAQMVQDSVVQPEEEPSAPIEEKVGYLSISSSPSGAIIYIDGKSVGKTPINGYELTVGKHRVRVKNGSYYKELNRVVVIASGQQTKEQYTLEVIEQKEEPRNAKAKPSTANVEAPAATTTPTATPKVENTETSSNAIFMVVDDQPEFPGGKAALMQFIKNNLKYPEYAMEKGIQGCVTLSFVVEKDGSITDIQEMRSPAEILTNEAKRVVRAMPRWKPGKYNGQSVRVKYVLPITFRFN